MKRSKPYESAITELEEALKTDDKSNIDAKTANLTQASSALAQRMYAEQAQAEAGNAGDDSGGQADDSGAVDAEFEEVKEDK